MLFFNEWGTLSSSHPFSPVFSGSHCLQDQVQTLCPEIQGLLQAGSRRPYQQCFSTALHCEPLAPVRLVCSLFSPPKHTHTAPQKEKEWLLYLSMPLVSFTWITLAPSHALLNPVWTWRPIESHSLQEGLLDHPYPQRLLLHDLQYGCHCDGSYGSSFTDAPSSCEVAYSLCPAMLLVLWYSFSLRPSCPSTLSCFPCKLLSIYHLSFSFASKPDYQVPPTPVRKNRFLFVLP